MRPKYLELENLIAKLLPSKKSFRGEVSSIGTLTREFMEECSNVRPVWGYSHSVCHLFEKYGRDNGEGGYSYLCSEELFPISEKLVETTLKNAMRGGDFSCIGRIIGPIVSLNLDFFEENQGGFKFKPVILENEEFIREYSRSREGEQMQYLLDFCNAKSIQDFFPQYVDHLRKMEKMEGFSGEFGILKGVFIDVEDTLIQFEGWDKDKPIYSKLPLIEEYALRKLEEGISVTVFTSSEIDFFSEVAKECGLDERLLNFKSKKDFIGKTLEICVDDSLPHRQGFKTRRYYRSGKEAWEKEYSLESEVMKNE